MRALVVICAVLVAVALAQESVTIQNCQDGQCTTGCQSQSFTTNECLTESGTSDTVQLDCSVGPNMCNDMKIYQDSQCADESQMVLANNVCNSCQSNFTVSCGALHNAVFVAVNCTDVACQDCGGAIIVPFQKCTNVVPLGYIMVTKVAACHAVTLRTFNDTDCDGFNYTQQYQSGQCFGGTIMTCN